MHEETVSQEVSLRDYLDLLRRRAAIIIQTLIAVIVIGVIVALISKPVYSSTGRLLISPQSLMLMRGDTSDPFSNLAGAQQNHNIATQMEKLLTGKMLSAAYEAAGQRAGDPRIRVSLGRQNEEAEIIDVTTEAPSAVSAQEVTNNLMSLFVKDDSDDRVKDIREAIKYAEKSLKEAQTEWQKASAELQKFQQRTRIPDYASKVTAASNTLNALDARINELDAQMRSLQALNMMTRQQRAALAPTIKTVTDSTNPDVIERRNKLADLKGLRAGLIQKYRPEMPQVKDVDEQIKYLEDWLAKLPTSRVLNTSTTNPEIITYDGKLRDQEQQRAAFQASMDRLQAQRVEADKALNTLVGQQYNGSKLMVRVETARKQTEQLTDRLNDLKLREAATPRYVEILADAPRNDAPVRPNRVLIVGLSGVMGLFLGVCFALLAEFLDDRVNAPEDARRIMGVPALGYIPNVEKSEQRLLTSTKGGSLLESYRVMRSNVRFAAVGEPLHTLMVTSTAPGEGKSTTACNLAIAMALDGKRVILVDADLRRPTVHEKFGARNAPGLTNVLVGGIEVDDALQPTDVEGLYLLTSGPIPPNPAELLNSRAMEQVQEMLKERADVVIFDSPPCLSVADAQVLAAGVDGLIYVVQLGSTKKSALKHGHELLRQAQARILGVVYNKVQVDSRKNQYYYGYYNYYHKTDGIPGKGDSNGKALPGGSTVLTADRGERAGAAPGPSHDGEA